jgi:hypothetical protein
MIPIVIHINFPIKSNLGFGGFDSIKPFDNIIDEIITWLPLYFENTEIL